MITKEILAIVGDPTDDGSRLNEIVDEFRSGRDVQQLVELLDSTNAELVSIGAWIPSELHFYMYNSEELVCRLRGLLDHDNPSVRFSALGAIYPTLRAGEERTERLLSRLRNDPNKGVRMRAEAAIARLNGD